ncbi:hypothetical protein VQ02_20085 [Methylobacterium variabile]|uniref:Uncharacterized protein n=1 Tax=Methylobacterium variabile TaxID=298794 RepID=A0A0J6SF47_9HYPH|nr:hypothetical protein [Methylobacterium variabile]KMO33845.1 hypothetical protein VQ02_20085 [Methylobacterium variabile]
MNPPATRRGPGDWRAVFGVPLGVGAATLAGLLAALLHEGAGWVAAWLALSLPLVLIAWHAGRAYARPGARRRPGSAPPRRR